jgi:hypothetical protein
MTSGAFCSLQWAFKSFWSSFVQTLYWHNGQLVFGCQSSLYQLLDQCGAALKKLAIKALILQYPRQKVFYFLALLSVYFGLMQILPSSKEIFESNLELFLAEVEPSAQNLKSRFLSPELFLEDLYFVSCHRQSPSRMLLENACSFVFSITKQSVPSNGSKHQHSTMHCPTDDKALRKPRKNPRPVMPSLLGDTDDLTGHSGQRDRVSASINLITE